MAYFKRMLSAYIVSHGLNVAQRGVSRGKPVTQYPGRRITGERRKVPNTSIQYICSGKTGSNMGRQTCFFPRRHLTSVRPDWTKSASGIFNSDRRAICFAATVSVDGRILLHAHATERIVKRLIGWSASLNIGVLPDWFPCQSPLSTVRATIVAVQKRDRVSAWKAELHASD